MYPIVRGFLYIVLWLFAAVLLGLTATRIHYTTHLPPGDPLNSGRNFYDPIVAELMACAALALIWSPIVLHMIRKRREHRYFNRVWHEYLGLFILWVMWLVGAAIATHIWPNLPSFCPQYEACRVLTAMLAFAWMGWIIITLLLLVTSIYAFTHQAWSEPAHGHWVRSDRNTGGYSSRTVRV